MCHVDIQVASTDAAVVHAAAVPKFVPLHWIVHIIPVVVLTIVALGIIARRDMGRATRI